MLLFWKYLCKKIEQFSILHVRVVAGQFALVCSGHFLDVMSLNKNDKKIPYFIFLGCVPSSPNFLSPWIEVCWITRPKTDLTATLFLYYLKRPSIASYGPMIKKKFLEFFLPLSSSRPIETVRIYCAHPVCAKNLI
jgi:hypothetical protein